MTASKISYFKLTLVFSLIIIAIIGCRRPPDYPLEPFIRFENLEFINANTLVLTFNYQDGDGDLGLNTQGRDEDPPYNRVFTVVSPANDPCNVRDTIADLSLLRDTDTTLYTYNNLTGFNVILNFLVKRDGEFERIPWSVEEIDGCSIVDTSYFPELRFPRISESISDEPVDGTIVVNPISTVGIALRSADTFLVEFYIYDRALNQSNTVRSNEIVVPQP